MKRFIFFLFLIVALYDYGLAFRPNFRVHTGISKPFAPNEFKEGWSTSANVGIGISKKIFPKTHAYLDIMYNRFTINSNDLIENQGFDPIYTTLDGSDWSTLFLCAGLKKDYPLINNPKVVPFFSGGIGFMKNMRDEMRLISSGSSEQDDQEVDEMRFKKINESAFAFHVSLGFELKLEQSSLFFDMGLLTGFTEDKTSIMPIRVGLIF